MAEKIDAWKCKDGSIYPDENKAKIVDAAYVLDDLMDDLNFIEKDISEKLEDNKNLAEACIDYIDLIYPGLIIDKLGKSTPHVHKGWDCPNSPDGECHYYSHDNKVALNNGALHVLPINHEKDDETEDMCIFCGEPEERK